MGGKRRQSDQARKRETRKIDNLAIASLGIDTLVELIADAVARDDVLRSRLVELCKRDDDLDHNSTESSDEPFMVGNSPQMRAAFEAIRRFAATDAPVLITGESGTGKELAAQAIHERSPKGSGPFVAINCGGLPSELIASELFGYEKGAFTGATSRKIGRIEAASGGTVFLDEIGDLPLELQPHLLRFLQERTIDRVGGRTPITVDVRIIAATNANLREAVAAGRFREDLFYRLDVLSLEMPPLRERGDDLELLSTFFLRRFSAETGRSFQGFTADALDAVRKHGWPGNVRELISCIRRSVVMANDEWIDIDCLGLADGSPVTRPTTAYAQSATAVAAPPSTGDGLRHAIEDYEKSVIQQALAEENKNIKRTAERLGVSRVTMYRLLEKHQLHPRSDTH